MGNTPASIKILSAKIVFSSLPAVIALDQMAVITVSGKKIVSIIWNSRILNLAIEMFLINSNLIPFLHSIPHSYLPLMWQVITGQSEIVGLWAVEENMLFRINLPQQLYRPLLMTASGANNVRIGFWQQLISQMPTNSLLFASIRDPNEPFRFLTNHWKKITQN